MRSYRVTSDSVTRVTPEYYTIPGFIVCYPVLEYPELACPVEAVARAPVLRPPGQRPVVGGGPAARLARLYHVCPLAEPGRGRGRRRLLPLGQVDAAQALRQGRLQALDVIVVVVHLLLEVADTEAHG